ncbi:MAG: AAA family ATPase [Bacteroidia bacterium]|nr:AAA family ATPase [Bacteroidia bacterium]
MLINFSNHPFETWDENHKNAAIDKYQSVKDIPFPHINPSADELDIKSEAVKYLELILNMSPDAVHIMGEMNFTFQMINYLMKEGIECIASTTDRVVEDFQDGTQKSIFKFVKFRSYNFLLEDRVENTKKGLVLNAGQKKAFELMKSFILKENDNDVFILKGYAGTGKTTLLRYFIEKCCEEKLTVTLMASTGRAAAVLKTKAKFNATTVHSLVYKFDEVKATSEDAWKMEGDEKGQLYLNFTPCLINDNDLTDVYIIDEASMISGFTNKSINGTKFGSGNLLNDLLEVVGNSKLIFVGDPCQLPPVDEASFSAALDTDFLRNNLHKKVIDFELTEIQRQGANSEILEIAAPLREQIISKAIPEWPKLEISNRYKDVRAFNSTDELIKQFLIVFKTVGSENCILVTHKNSEAHENNISIRKDLFPNKGSVQVGDILMIIKNCMRTGLRNGDQVIVQKIGESAQRAKQVFLRLTVKDINSGVVHDTMLIESLLNSSSSKLESNESRELIIDFDYRMKEAKIIRNSSDYKVKMKADIYINGLQAKYGYSITLQKAQGGEWQHVFLNITKSVYISKFEGKPQDMIKWFYTAITRTQKYLYLNIGSWIKNN